MNPLLKNSDLPFQATPFNELQNNHFIPALEVAITNAKKIIDSLCSEENPNFSNIIEKLEKSGNSISEISSVFFNLNSAETNDEMQELAKEFSKKLTEYSNEVNLNSALFSSIKTVYNNSDSLNLNPEQKTLLEKTYKGFKRNGALLSDDDKLKLREIDQKLAAIKVEFAQHVLADTNDYELLVENNEDLKGLPEDLVSAAAKLAAENGHQNKWSFSLHFPSFSPFITYAENRSLRKEIFLAFASRSCKSNENDNRGLCNEIAQLRKSRALLLGYNSHAEYVLEERMATNPENVQQFLNELLSKSVEKAKEQVNEVSLYAADHGAPLPLQKWDFAFWAEKLKKANYDIDDEELKPYFVLENVLNGAFQVAGKLYGLEFKENKELPRYNDDVGVYEVYEENGNFLSLFYADFFPRKGKRAGAWMTSYKNQYMEKGHDHRPHISIVCNFNPPIDSKPSLLTFREVTTLFHEFGHALHGMCAKGEYAELSGTNVFWDFVELPSQLMENWCFEKECLDMFAIHYETGEKIPAELVQKLKDSSTFLEGYNTLRQLSFGLLDMAWHHNLKEEIKDVSAFEKEHLAETALLPGVEGICISTSFQHIFNGGYSSGYYSYKWAEVLDADAFEAFKEKGIFDRSVAQAFKENILEKGGSEKPMDLYKRFRGKEPSIQALLKRAGLN